jgi:hypothetical protein
MKQPAAGTADPRRDHHMIDGQLIPVAESNRRVSRSIREKKAIAIATKKKGVEADKRTDAPR